MPPSESHTVDKTEVKAQESDKRKRWFFKNGVRRLLRAHYDVYLVLA